MVSSSAKPVTNCQTDQGEAGGRVVRQTRVIHEAGSRTFKGKGTQQTSSTNTDHTQRINNNSTTLDHFHHLISREVLSFSECFTSLFMSCKQGVDWLLQSFSNKAQVFPIRMIAAGNEKYSRSLFEWACIKHAHFKWAHDH